MMTRLRSATDSDRIAWNEFVTSHHQGSFFHLFEWRALLAEAFGLRPHYFIAERQGRVTGVLPLVEQRSLLFGNALMSTAFCVEGGPIADDLEAAKALDDAALDLLARSKSSFIEYRTRRASRDGWMKRSGLYATFARDLPLDDDAKLSAIPRKQRAVLRKALSGHLVGNAGHDVGTLFRVYSESMRNLGTPMFPKRYFGLLLDTFADKSDIVVIRDGYEPVAAVLNFYFRDTVLPYYGGGVHRARNIGANDLLYWYVMKAASAKGYTRFDFGRSKAGTGAFAFKKNWGFEPEWLEYEYFLTEGKKLPEKNQTNPLFASLSKIWKRLPLPIANSLGPILIKGLG